MARKRRDPPRWFLPAVLAGAIGAGAFLAGLIALNAGVDDASLTIGDRSYAIPADHVASLRRESDIFVRVRAPGQPFEIVHDGRLAGLSDAKGVPLIFSVNDQDQPDIAYLRDGHTLVACRRASGAVGSCGTWITYGGATWSVLFPESRTADADKFAREATLLLKKYDPQSLRWIG